MMKESTARAVKSGRWYYVVDGKGRTLVNARYTNIMLARSIAKEYNAKRLTMADILNIQYEEV